MGKTFIDDRVSQSSSTSSTVKLKQVILCITNATNRETKALVLLTLQTLPCQW